MKLNTILAFLSIASTQALETPGSSDVLCENDLNSSPVLCGVDGEEFESLCLATKVGGFEESSCLSKDLLDLFAPGERCPLDSTYKPMVCTSAQREGIRETFDNPCAARILGGYEDIECICDEFEDIVHLLFEKFEEENCQLTTKAPDGENDAKVVYSCQNVLDENEEGTDSRHILEVILVATGILGDAPTPDFFTINLNEANQPSTTVGIPLSVSFGYRNNCRDHENTEMLLRVYN